MKSVCSVFFASYFSRQLRRPLVCVALLLLLVDGCFAASQPLWWRVQAADSKPVYLLGSIHFGHESMYPLPEPIMAAYRQADALAVELDIAKLDSARVARLISAYGVYPEGQTLQGNLDPATWKKMQDVCAQLDVESVHFLKTRPWLVAVQLISLQMQKTDFREDQGVDRYFLQQARTDKPIWELETIEDQLSIFYRLTAREQEIFLRQTLDTYGQGQEFLHELSRAWREGDGAALEKMILESFAIEGASSTESQQAGKKLFDLVFGERNQRMATSIEQYLERGQGAFVVMGVGHMLGEEGVVAVLRRRGYRVDPMAEGLAD